MNAKKLILFGILCTVHCALSYAAPATLSILTSSQVVAGQITTSTITLNTAGGIQGGADFFVTFDTRAVAINGISAVASQYKDAFYFNASDLANGRLHVLALNGASNQAPTGTVTLATMTFTAANISTITTLDAQANLIIDTQPVAYSPITIVPSSFTILASSSPADRLPPRTSLSVGQPSVAGIPVMVRCFTPISLQAVVDRSVMGDGLGVGVAQTRYGVDGSTFSLYAAPFFLTQIGTHTVTFFSTDQVGNVETATSTVVAVADASTPVTTLVFGAPPYVDSSSRTFISTSTALSFTVSGPAGAVTQYVLDGGAPVIFSSSFTLSEGAHTFAYESQNIFGFQESAHSITLGADGTPPAVEVIFAPQAAFDADNHILLTTQTAVALQVQDALSGFATAQVSLDGGAFQLYQGTFTIALGSHTLAAQVFDHVGNERNVAPFTFLVGTTVPASTGPAGGTLPDGTPIVVSPDPITVLPPGGGSGGTGSQPPIVKQVTLSPASPVGRGTVTFTVQFSKPMNNVVNPSVTFLPQGQSPVSIAPSSFVGDTWTGTAQITDTMNSGVATLLVSGAQDGQGQAITQTVSTFQIALTLPAPPASVTASPKNGQLVLSWPAVPAVASYNLYRTTYTVSSRVGLAPLQSGAASGFADSPSPDTSVFYYGVTSVAQDGTEGVLSPITSQTMPLPPVITRPAEGANVDFASTVVQGLAQPGVLVDLSTAALGAFGQTLVTATAAQDRHFAANLTLGHGPFQIVARARSGVTGLVSSTAAVNVNIIDLPNAPANVQAAGGDTTVTLTWTQSAQVDVIGYNIYRDGGAVPLNSSPLPANQTSYQDLALTDGRTYSYIMTSVRTGNVESLPSAPVQATPVAGTGWGQ